MIRSPWKAEVDDGPPGPTSDVAIAYRAGDGRFDLLNDYGQGCSVLRRKSQGPDDPDPLGRGPPQPGVRPLATTEPTEGYGMFTFPYGPIAGGFAEAGRFDVRTYGERVLELVPVGGFKSRRIARSVVGRSVVDAALWVERTAGQFSAAHTTAFLQAAESATGTPVGVGELWVRALAQETQRVYNHAHVLARLAEAAAQNVGAAQAQAFAEEMLRLQGTVFGHRFLFGALLPGGPVRHLAADDRRRITESLRRLQGEFERLWPSFLESRTFIDRLQSTATISRAQAIALGVVGPTLRACGVDWDDRLRSPYPPYDDLFVSLPKESGGDALGRLLVRAEEVRSSFLLLEQLLDRWPSSPNDERDPPPPVLPGRGIGRVEAPSGDLVYDVRVVDGKVDRLGVRSASDALWSALSTGMRDAVFTDFHFALESFGLAFAETDG